LTCAAGPKMRKWYGETDKLVMPKDGGPQQGDSDDDDEEPTGSREAIVVVGGDTELGELIIMQLVLARCEPTDSAAAVPHSKCMCARLPARVCFVHLDTLTWAISA
jgi:hypothetical protein